MMGGGFLGQGGLNPFSIAPINLPDSPMGQVMGMQPQQAQQAQQQPFLWGAGGTRLTPDQLALRQKVALQNTQADYSPIQSPWQGLARVAQNVMGALDEKSLDKQSAAMNGMRAQVVAGLNSPDPAVQSQAVAAALAGQDPVLQKFGTDVYNRAHPNNDTVNDYNFRVATLGKDAANQALARTGDPMVTVTLPGGQFYSGPQSGLTSVLNGGQAPSATPPATLPSDFDFGNH